MLLARFQPVVDRLKQITDTFHFSSGFATALTPQHQTQLTGAFIFAVSWLIG